MRALEDCNGPWVGAWVQFGLRGHMRLTLSFVGGRIMGGGSDRVGPFQIIGHYEASNLVEMVKTYATHTVHYSGKWDGSMISGQWRIGLVLIRGTFEIWPESEDLGIESLSEEVETFGPRELVSS